jgi:tyrosine-protein kinase
MKPQDVVTAIKKRWWVIVTLVLVAALAGTVMARVKTPVYKVEINLAATPPISKTTGSPDATIGIYYQTNMATIANASESIDIALATHERLKKAGIDIPAEELLKKISATPVANSNSFKIAASDGSPTRVADIANAWGTETALRLSNDPILLGGTLEITNKAIPPEKPTQPKPLVYLGLGLFLGAVLGFTIVIGWEYFDPHFRSEQETEEMLGVPVLGTLPKKSVQNIGGELYSGLRASILFSLDGKEASSVAIANAVPDTHGQSIAINLAKSIASAGDETLLVDSDLREHTVSELMGAGSLSGLAEVIENDESVEDKIAQTSVPNLFLLPAGRTSMSPSDLLSKASLPAVLKELEGSYHWVIISVPPLTKAVDAALVASKAQASLVVIDAETCTRNTALDALQNLRRLQLEPSGVVLYNMKESRRERKLKQGE